jgi:Tetratricopeptide repeat
VALPPRPTRLAGREDLLAGLHVLLTVGDRPVMVVLCGLGGVGNTTVAIEYAHRHLAEVGVAWQVAAGDQTVLAAEMAELAAQLGALDLLDARDPIASVHAALASHPADWLLVFDNAPDTASLRRFLPPAGRGRILITSQSAHWPGMQMLDVPVLTNEVSSRFLMNRTADPDEEAAADLAADLGGLPLALDQAAAYIQATGSSLAAYRDLFRHRQAELLARGEAPDHPATVAATLTLAMSRLEERAPAAAGLLRLLAFLAPEPVPLALLQADDTTMPESDASVTSVLRTLDDPVAVGDAVAALRQYSLVTPVDKGTVLVHRLVQAVTLNQIPPDTADSWQQAAATLIRSAIPADTGSPEAWSACAVLLPHAQTVLADDHDAMAQMAIYLSESGNYAAARDLWRKITDALMQSAGAVHLDTLSARDYLARSIGEAGDPAEARDMYAQLLPISERLRGPEHRSTLNMRANVALWTGEAGDEARARDMYAELLRLEERLLPKDPGTIVTRFNHAAATGKSGDWVGARDLITALLPSAEQAFGTEDSYTLNARAFLAAATGQAGDATGALRQCLALLPVYQRVFGVSHPDTLLRRSNVAYWTGAAGDAAGARDLFAALVPDAEKVLGQLHPVTLSSRTELGFWTGLAGDPDEARSQLDEVRAAAERVLGAEHPDTLTAGVYFARFVGEAGEPALARDQLVTLLSATERVLGAEHPHALAARGELARWTGEAGDPVGARDILTALLPARERVRGVQHSETVNDRDALDFWTRKADTVRDRVEPTAVSRDLPSAGDISEEEAGQALSIIALNTDIPGNT